MRWKLFITEEAKTLTAFLIKSETVIKQLLINIYYIFKRHLNSAKFIPESAEIQTYISTQRLLSFTDRFRFE